MFWGGCVPRFRVECGLRLKRKWPSRLRGAGRNVHVAGAAYLGWAIEVGRPKPADGSVQNNCTSASAASSPRRQESRHVPGSVTAVASPRSEAAEIPIDPIQQRERLRTPSSPSPPTSALRLLLVSAQPAHDDQALGVVAACPTARRSSSAGTGGAPRVVSAKT